MCVWDDGFAMMILTTFPDAIPNVTLLVHWGPHSHELRCTVWPVSAHFDCCVPGAPFVVQQDACATRAKPARQTTNRRNTHLGKHPHATQTNTPHATAHVSSRPGRARHIQPSAGAGRGASLGRRGHAGGEVALLAGAGVRVVGAGAGPGA